MTPCPRCGEPRGSRYGPRKVCWPCLGIKPETPQPPTRTEWQRFRYHVLDRLARLDRSRFWPQLDRDRCAGACPVCKADPPDYLLVRFHGQAPRANLICSLGCPEADIAAAFGLEVEP